MLEHIDTINKAISQELGSMSEIDPDRPFVTSLLLLMEAYTNKKPSENLPPTETKGSSRYKTVVINGILVGQLRKERELTQAELAKLMIPPRSRGYISVIEGQEQARISTTTASALANALNIGTQDLNVKIPQ